MTLTSHVPPGRGLACGLSSHGGLRPETPLFLAAGSAPGNPFGPARSAGMAPGVIWHAHPGAGGHEHEHGSYSLFNKA